MLVAGEIRRIEILPETEDEKKYAQRLINYGQTDRHPGAPLIYWGDSDRFGGALIINSFRMDDEGVKASQNDGNPAVSQPEIANETSAQVPYRSETPTTEQAKS